MQQRSWSRKIHSLTPNGFFTVQKDTRWFAEPHLPWDYDGNHDPAGTKILYSTQQSAKSAQVPLPEVLTSFIKTTYQRQYRLWAILFAVTALFFAFGKLMTILVSKYGAYLD